VARRPADYTTKLQAEAELKQKRLEQRRKDDERRKRIAARQANAYGTVVIETTDMCFDIDQLAGILCEARKRVEAEPALAEGWRQQGREFFRGPPNDNDTTEQADGSPPEADHADPAAVRPEIRPETQPDRDANGAEHPRTTASRSRPAREPAPGTADLLGGIATDRTGASPAEAA
jgi:hypothetical protein